MSMSNDLSPLSESSSSDTEYVISPENFALKMKIPAEASLEELHRTIDEIKCALLNDITTEERVKLVRFIVELRLRVQEVTDIQIDSPKLSIWLLGHRFQIQSTSKSNSKQYCDHCSGVIWNIIQGSYMCSDCNFICHAKCVDDIRRACVQILLAEKGKLEMEICPEKGLDAQNYKCAECNASLVSTADRLTIPSRLCDYNGLYYCLQCHWNDKLPIPARVVHNWDWQERPVSRVSYQLLKLAFTQPLINIEVSNPSLFKHIHELEWVRTLRKSFVIVQQYLNMCPSTKSNGKLIRDIFEWTASPKHYSMANLENSKEGGTLEPELDGILKAARSHITNCEHCSGKGYLCEMCGDKQVIFPFDNVDISCIQCNSLYHRHCWKKNNSSCLKCKRIAERKLKNVD